MKTTLVITADFSALQNELEKLKAELSIAIGERDELVSVIVKNLKMRYMLKLGNLEYRVYEMYCKSLRARRKLQMIQAALNRQEKIVIEKINSALDEEFFEYQQNLEQKMKDINDALERSKGKTLSNEDANEIKKLYRKIVKALHPDINSNLSEQQLALYHNAVEAYDCGDFLAIKTIAAMISDEDFSDDENSFTKLEEKIASLKACIKNVRKEIENIKIQFPYNQKTLLEDENKIEEKRAELEQLSAEYEKVYKEYLAEIKNLTGAYNE